MTILKRMLIVFVISLQVVFYPAAALADTGDPSTTGGTDPGTSSTQAPDSAPASTPSSDPTTSSDPASTPPTDPATSSSPTNDPSTSPPTTTSPSSGPTTPPGADGTTYHYNSATGMWENDYYIWNPVTHQTTPKNAPNYSYNSATGTWDSTQWTYDAPTGHYVPKTVSSSSAPLGVAANDPIISFTGAGSNNGIHIGTTNNALLNLTYDGQIINDSNTTARSGNASVLQNTKAGNALSGSADATANFLNMLQSSWDPSYGNLDTFRADVNGNVSGDLLLDPTYLISHNNGNADITNDDTNNLTVNDRFSGRIDNNINLGAQSGDAMVDGNTEAGNAKSGDANAVANIINLMNSSIHAGHSFVGVLNINGNLDGDILLPQWLLDGLISQTGPGSNSTINSNQTNNLNANLSDTQGVNNNVTANAAAGNASVANNTQAGNATGGQATTNVTILNLTGKQVNSKDAILVFVNVFGKWVGLIMNKPGTTASLGIDNNSGNASIDNNRTNNLNINANSNELINNNVNVGARSGDATVQNNTVGGDATSGNAHAGANIANIIGSDINASDWFGVLFINVFGNWNGSFGTNTAAGSPAAALATGQAGGAGGASQPNVFGFVPHSATTSVNTGSGGSVFGTATTDAPTPTPPASQKAPASQPATSNQPAVNVHSNWGVIIAGLIAGVALLGLERLLALWPKKTVAADKD